MEIVLVLNDIRSVYNVGAILRTCDGLGVKRVLLSGYTPCPNDSSKRLPHIVNKERSAIAKTALGAEKSVDCLYCKNIIASIKDLQAAGYTLVGLENNVKNKRIYALGDIKLHKKLGSKIVLILGEEVAGIADGLLTEMDFIVEIPMCGKKESFNVSVAAGIALWELTRLRS